MHIKRLSGLGASLKSFEMVACSVGDAGEETTDLSAMFPVKDWSAWQGLQQLEVSLQDTVTDRRSLADLTPLIALAALLLEDLGAECEALPRALPTSLQRLELSLEFYESAIPKAVETLPELQWLKFYMGGRSAILSNSLISLIEMPRLARLEFTATDRVPYVHWTPEALKFLGQALAHLCDSGSKLNLVFCARWRCFLHPITCKGWQGLEECLTKLHYFQKASCLSLCSRAAYS